MKKIVLFLCIVLLSLSVHCQKTAVIKGNFNDMTTVDDSLWLTTEYQNEDWMGKNVVVTTYIRYTEDDDATIHYGGSDKRATKELKDLEWITTEKDFYWVNVSGITINPLVVDTAGTDLLPNVQDTTYYQCKFNIESFSWPEPAVYIIKNSCDSAEFIIMFEQIK